MTIKFEKEKEIATLSNNRSGSLELNYGSWNGGANKYDLRRWNDEGKALKGLCMTREEAYELMLALESEFDHA